MKTIFLVLLLSINFAMASTGDGHSFPILENDSEENFSLKTVQTRTAYSQQTVARTCYRTELVGYRNVCEYYPEVRCHETRDRARVCRPTPIYRCHQVPQYRQVPYTCYQTISTPYEVFDHNVVANLNVKIASKPKEPTNPTGCSITFNMVGENLSSFATCSNLLVLANQKKSSEIDQTGTVIHHVASELNLLDSQNTLAPLSGGIRELKVSGDVLTFKTGDLLKNPNFNLKLDVERKRLLKSDKTLINRNLSANEYTFEKSEDNSGIVKIDLNKLLGGFEDDKKHVIKIHLSINLEVGTLLNQPAPTLSTSDSITIND